MIYVKIAKHKGRRIQSILTLSNDFQNSIKFKRNNIMLNKYYNCVILVLDNEQGKIHIKFKIQ